MSEKYPQLRLENQLCFPLYAAGREIVRRYTPYLAPFDLTYTQYIVMMVLWERERATVSEIGDILYLDSGTLTPLLKKLEAREFITRTRSEKDQRSVEIGLTAQGREMEEKLSRIPFLVSRDVKLQADEVVQLYGLLYRLLDGFEPSESEN